MSHLLTKYVLYIYVYVISSRSEHENKCADKQTTTAHDRFNTSSLANLHLLRFWGRHHWYSEMFPQHIKHPPVAGLTLQQFCLPGAALCRHYARMSFIDCFTNGVVFLILPFHLIQDLYQKRTIVVEMNCTNMTQCCWALYKRTCQRVMKSWHDVG